VLVGGAVEADLVVLRAAALAADAERTGLDAEAGGDRRQASGRKPLSATIVPADAAAGMAIKAATRTDRTRKMRAAESDPWGREVMDP